MLLRLGKVKERPDLVGQSCKIVDGNAAAGVWKVETEKGESLEVKPTSLEVPSVRRVHKIRECEVVIGGLNSKPELNGVRAPLGNFVAQKQRWKVYVKQGEKPILLKSQNLTLANGGAPVQEPVSVGDCQVLEQKALYAAKDIKQGQIIFEEDPFIAVDEAKNFKEQAKHYADCFLSLSKSEQTRALEMCANPHLRIPEKLQQSNKWTRSPNMRVAFEELELDRHVPEEHHEDVWKFMRVMQTNAFQMKDGSQGLFETLCRSNHSCQPNAMRYDHGNGKTVIALRDLRKGEDICINYMSDTQLLEPRRGRQEFIKTWGFACACPVCSEPQDSMRVFLCPMRCGGQCTGTADGLSPCDKCEVEYANADSVIGKEATFVTKVLELDKNPFLLSASPGTANDLRKGMEEVMHPLHWAFARLNDIEAGYHQQVGDHKQALHCMTKELEFWAHHLQRPSQQAAWKRKLRADVLVDTGNFPTAFSEYVRALDELEMVMPMDCQHCTELRGMIDQVLVFRRNPQQSRQYVKNGDAMGGYPTNAANIAAFQETLKKTLGDIADKPGHRKDASEDLFAALSGLINQQSSSKAF